MIATVLVSPQAAAFNHAYTTYTAILQKRVQWIADGHSSAVDYGALKRDRAALGTVLKTWSAIGPEEFKRWSGPQQMAFLINAYNGFTLELILTAHPDLKSIRDLGSLLRSPWKKPFFSLLGEERSLDWIEHEQLRPVYRDPRVHFGVNCASIGCPALRPEAFVAERLDVQLDDQQRRFLTDRTRNRFNAADGRLHVSQVFKWFSEDFQDGGGDLKAWMAARGELFADNDADRARLRRGAFLIEHLSYDWSLNALGKK